MAKNIKKALGIEDNTATKINNNMKEGNEMNESIINNESSFVTAEEESSFVTGESTVSFDKDAHTFDGIWREGPSKNELNLYGMKAGMTFVCNGIEETRSADAKHKFCIRLVWTGVSKTGKTFYKFHKQYVNNTAGWEKGMKVICRVPGVERISDPYMSKSAIVEDCPAFQDKDGRTYTKKVRLSWTFNGSGAKFAVISK